MSTLETNWIGRNTAGRAGAFADKRLAESNSMLGRAADSRIGRFARSYTTGALAESKFGGGVSRKADLEKIKKEKTDIANNRRVNNLRGTVESTNVPENLTLRELAGIHPSKRAAAQATRKALQDSQRDTLEKTYQKMSNKELETLGASDLEKNVQYMSASQFEHIVDKSDKFNEQEKESIKNARFAALKTALDPASADPAKAKGLTKALSDKEIEILDSAITTSPEFIKNLSQSQIDSILKSQKFTSTQKAKVREAVIAPLKEAIRSNNVSEIGKILKNMKGNQVAKLDSVILLDNNVVSQLTPTMMQEMPKELSDDTLKQIGDKIKAIQASGGSHPAFKYIDPAGNGRGKDFFN